jgi:ribosomal-protein-alanine N-acetyltransferase
MEENNLVTFRPMRKDDLDSVMKIDRLSFSLPWPESAYQHDLINKSKAILLVAEYFSGGSEVRIVGMIDLWLILDDAHIATLAVHPDYRGMGIATRLIEGVLVEAYEKGARRAMLEVRTSNSAAQKLYEKFGFKVVHRRPRYYVDNREDALLMNLDDLEAWIRSSNLKSYQKTS